MKGWRYILWYKEGSISYIAGEYRAFRKEKKNYKEWVLENGKEWNDYVTGIDYNEYRVNLVEYGLCRRYVHKGGGRKGECEDERKIFWFDTDFLVGRKNVQTLE